MLVFVRHGLVENPDDLVYADLPGFVLAAEGHRQAATIAHRLADLPVVAIWSSPLVRALQTAHAIATPHRLPVQVDDGLVEWRLLSHWAGIPWDRLPERRPGELEAYLDHPEDLSFSPESLAELGDRVADVARRVDRADGLVVAVSHQDPIHAGVRRLTDTGFGAFHTDKPDHAMPIALSQGTPWVVGW